MSAETSASPASPVSPAAQATVNTSSLAKAQTTAVGSKGKAHGQTGPKSIAGKNRSRWNALKDGATAKSAVLPFEDARVYQRHIREVEKALEPTNYVEAQLVREYAEGLWRIIRHEKRGSYQREEIFKRLTPVMMAQMLGLEECYWSCAPDYLMDLTYNITQREEARAKRALSQYAHLQTNAKGIANFNMVWRQYPDLFEGLSLWLIAIDPGSTPIFASTGKDLNLPWQQNPQKLTHLLEKCSKYLYYVAHFESFKPHIRVWMESWFFLQRTEMRKLEHDDQLLLKERNHTHSILDKLMRFRKSNLYLVTLPGDLSLMQGKADKTGNT